MSNILLTGSTGFIGRAVLDLLLSEQNSSSHEHSVSVAVRSAQRPRCSEFVVGDISSSTDWDRALTNIDVVVHAAARAHVRDEAGAGEGFYRVNRDATLNLAEQAASSGVRRFIFISTIGVNGSSNSSPFTEADEPSPENDYAQSKWEAEQGLWAIQQKTDMEVVILRPPLVYGPGAPGNFGRMVRWVSKGVPLPLGSIPNKRSLLALENLAHLILVCIDHPAATNQLFLVADGEDVSTSELLREVAHAMGRPPRLIPVPVGAMELMCSLLGKQKMMKQLTGSLQVDSSKVRDYLDWTPPVGLKQGLQNCF